MLRYTDGVAVFAPHIIHADGVAVFYLYLSRKKLLYCAFVDYRKAFDLIDRLSLWCKLSAQGINGNVIKVVYNMNENAKSCITLNGAISEFCPCNIRVRQDENLSPLLFV